MPRSLAVFLLSGRPDLIENAVQGVAAWTSLDIRPFDEKTITSLSRTRDLFNATSSTAVAFACKDLDLQRFQLALKFYLLLYGRGDRFLVDETGNITDVTWSRFIFRDLVRFALEITASVGVLLHAVFRLTYLRRRKGGRR